MLYNNVSIPERGPRQVNNIDRNRMPTLINLINAYVTDSKEPVTAYFCPPKSLNWTVCFCSGGLIKKDLDSHNIKEKILGNQKQKCERRNPQPLPPVIRNKLI